MSERSFEQRHSVCPYCGVGCGIEYTGNGRSADWKAPVNTRGEVCPKGAAAWEVVDHDDRLRQPLVREHGTLVTAPWAEALDRVETALTDIVAEHGADALAFVASSNCINEENYLFQKLARVLGTNNVDNCARLCHSSVAAMSARLGVGAMTNTLEGLIEADCYLVTGANPAEQHPIIFRSYLLPAIREGTDLIHVDPRATDATDAADLHLPVRPGYDIPLLNAVCAVVLEEDPVDEAFVAERTEEADALREHLADVDVAANAAAAAAVDPEDLRTAARTFATADRAAAFTGMGMSQHHCRTDNVHALLNLVLLTGNVGRPGTGVNPLRGQNNVQGAGDVGALPSVLPGYEPVTDPDARERVADVWGVESPAEPGLTEVELTHRFDEEIRGAFVFGENPAVTEPNGSTVAGAFDDLGFLAVLDLFETETAALADVVLPGSAWAEKAGTVTNTDRRVRRMRPNADPPGVARRDLEVLQTVGARVTDRPDAFRYGGPEAVFEELTDVTPLYAGLSYDRIGDGDGRWPFPDGAETRTDILHEERFATGEATAPLVPVDHVPPADDLAEDDLVLTTGRVL